MNNALIKLDKATYMLAEAKTLEEVKKILDVAEAARTYARAAKLGLEAYNHAAEVKVRAERMAGEMLAKLERVSGLKRGPIRQPVESESEYKSILDEHQISYKQAERWQQLAGMEEDKFNQEIIDMWGEKPITKSAILKEIQKGKIDLKRKEMVENGRKVSASDKWQVYCCDIATWQAPRQYDFIITDPPYPKEFLSLYGVLARRALDWLKPSGLLIAMCGQSYLDEIFREMSNHLDYYWIGAYLTPKLPTPLRQKQVNTTWKPLLMFIRPGEEYKGKTFNDVFISDPESMKTDKNYHDWGQSISGMNSIIKMVCQPGQYILDPFCGSGTTGIAAIQHDCFFDGIDIDEENVKISKARINDATKKG